MGGEGSFHAAMLLGPLGGIVAAAFAAGAASGWGFCVATILRITNKQIARLEKELADEKAECARAIHELRARVKEVEDRYTNGMERQLSQVRQSSVEIIERDVRHRRIIDE